MKLTKGISERAFKELRGQEGFSHHLVITIARRTENVLMLIDV